MYFIIGHLIITERKDKQNKDFLIRIYQTQFQFLQTSAETDDTLTVIIQQHWETSFSQLPLVLVSFRFPFPFHHASTKVQHVSFASRESFVTRVRRLVAVTPALLVG